MRVTEHYPAPVQGISTLAPRNRGKGFAAVQENFRSDPVNKLSRRPSLNWITPLVGAADASGGDFFHHSYTRDGILFRYLLQPNDTVLWCFRDEVLIEKIAIPVAMPAVADNLVAQTIGEDTYFLDTTTVVEMETQTDDSLGVVEKVSYINITSALNYGESIEVSVTRSNGDTTNYIYTIPDVGVPPDYDAADEARATNTVAAELALLINDDILNPALRPNPDYPADITTDPNYINFCLPATDTGGGVWVPNGSYDPNQSVCKPYLQTTGVTSNLVAIAKGSSVSVRDGLTDEWVVIEISAGQGERVSVVVNEVIETTNGLPLYAIANTRLTIKPDPTTDNGTYYLNAEPVSDDSPDIMEEVVWVESRSPFAKFKLDETTLPFVCRFTAVDNPVIQVDVWDDREVGNIETVEEPAFVGETITNIGYLQKRLVFLSENNVIMSKTDDVGDFWKRSGVTSLVTDTLSIASSEVGIDKLAHIVTHNRDALVIASNGQFKIDGTAGITPNVSMGMTTKYVCQTNTAPVIMGNSVILPITQGSYSGLLEYSSQVNTSQDEATDITVHTIGYMQGTVTHLVASTNLNMIAVRVTGSTFGGKQRIFIFEGFKVGGERIQQSWSSWLIYEGDELIDMKFKDSTLQLIIRTSGDFEPTIIVLKEFNMYDLGVTGIRADPYVDSVFLDDKIAVRSFNGTSVTLPAEYDPTNIIVVGGVDTTLPLQSIPFTIDGSTITFPEDINDGVFPTCVVYIGRTFVSSYGITRPFRYTQEGIADTSERVRVSKYILDVVDTNEVAMNISSEFYDEPDQEFNARILNSPLNQLGVVPLYSGDVQFSFGQDASLANATFYCNNWLSCTISGIRWQGQATKSQGGL